MVINSISCFTYTLPFHAPLPAGDTLLTAREGLLVALEADTGRMGWGEAAPLRGFSRESLEEVIRGAYELALQVRGMRFDRESPSLELRMTRSPSLHFAFSSALQALAARERGVALHRHLGAHTRETVPLCALIDGDVETKCVRARRAAERGCRTLKLKVGGKPWKDAELVRTIAGDIAPNCRLRLDANRAWNREEALRFCGDIPADRIEFLEEPVKDFRDIPVIQEALGIPCAVDETLQQLSRIVLESGGTDGQQETGHLRSVIEQARFIVWKPSFCLPVSLLGVNAVGSVILSAAYESGLGTAVLLAHAAAMTEPDRAAGVDTYSRLASDVLDLPLALDDPEAVMVQVESARETVNPTRMNLLWHV